MEDRRVKFDAPPNDGGSSSSLLSTSSSASSAVHPIGQIGRSISGPGNASEPTAFAMYGITEEEDDDVEKAGGGGGAGGGSSSRPSPIRKTDRAISGSVNLNEPNNFALYGSKEHDNFDDDNYGSKEHDFGDFADEEDAAEEEGTGRRKLSMSHNAVRTSIPGAVSGHATNNGASSPYYDAAAYTAAREASWSSGGGGGRRSTSSAAAAAAAAAATTTTGGSPMNTSRESAVSDGRASLGEPGEILFTAAREGSSITSLPDINPPPAAAAAVVTPNNSTVTGLTSSNANLSTTPTSSRNNNTSNSKKGKGLKTSTRTVVPSMRLPNYRGSAIRNRLSRHRRTVSGGAEDIPVSPNLSPNASSDNLHTGAAAAGGAMGTSLGDSGRHRRFQSEAIPTTQLMVDPDADIVPAVSDTSLDRASSSNVNASRPGAYRVTNDTGSTCTVRRPLGAPVRQGSGTPGGGAGAAGATPSPRGSSITITPTNAGAAVGAAGVVAPPQMEATPRSSVSFDSTIPLSEDGDQTYPHQRSDRGPPRLAILEGDGQQMAAVSAITMGTGANNGGTSGVWTGEEETVPGGSRRKDGTPWYCTGKFKCFAVLVLIGVVVAIIVPVSMSGGGGSGGSGDDGNTKAATGPTPSPATVNEDAIREVILTISSESDLENINSVQHWAFKWLIEQDQFDIKSNEEYKLLQRYSLVCLYYSTGRESRLKPKQDECTWDGVGCNADKSSVHIGEILFTECDGTLCQGTGINHNDGLIPSELGYLTTIERLDLPSSGLTNFSINVLKLLPNLKTLDLIDNDINVEIPEGLYDLVSLETLFLRRNDIKGSISSSISKMKKLGLLDISGNKLDGDIPTEFMSLPNLHSLVLDRNDLGGNITEIFPLMDSLEIFRAEATRITGQVPTEIGTLQNFKELWLSNNGGMEGSTLPTEIGNIEGLKVLRFESCYLGGTIPSELGKLSNLLFLILSDNSFVSKIPSELGNLGNLEELKLADNELIGSVPSELGRLSNLEQLHLMGNNLNGTIHQNICNLKESDGKLEFLFVDCTVNCTEECCGKCRG